MLLDTDLWADIDRDGANVTRKKRARERRAAREDASLYLENEVALGLQAERGGLFHLDGDYKNKIICDFQLLLIFRGGKKYIVYIR